MTDHENYWILITGVSGFIGQNLSQVLISENYSVLGIDIKDPPAELSDNPTFRFIKADLQSNDLSDYFEEIKISWLFHLGGIASNKISFEYPVKTYSVNIIGSINLLESLKKSGNRPHVVLASTTELYGKINSLILENSSIKPNSPYSYSKKICEDLWQYHAAKNFFPWTIFRFSNTYGRNSSEQGYVVEFIIDRLLHEQEINIRTPNEYKQFLFVTDHINAYLSLLRSNTKNNIINIAGKTLVRIENIKKIVKLLLDKKESKFSQESKLRDLLDSPGNNEIDITKAKKLLNWNPTIDFLSGLRETIKVLKAKTNIEL